MIREFAAEKAGSGTFLTPSEIVTTAGGLQEFVTPSRTPGVRLPWPSLNRMLAGGMKPQQLIILAARPSLGKTSLAMHAADFVAENGEGVAVFSLEMSASELLFKVACTRAKIDSTAARRGCLNASERRDVASAVSRLAEIPLYIDESASCTVARIVSSIRKLQAKTRLGLVIVDYLQLMSAPGKFSNREEAVSSMSRGLKLAAKEFNLPFLVLAQLNRKPETERRRPTLADFRESGSVEQDCDVAMFLHADYENGQQQRGKSGLMSLIIAKQRNGPIGEIPLYFHAPFTRFDEATNA